MTKKFFNIMLPPNMIAQAYAENQHYDADCYLVGPLMGDIPSPYILDDDIYIDGFNLMVNYNQHEGYQKEYFIEDGDLKCIIREGGQIASIVDLGRVVGPQGETGATGPQGPAGITPTFYIENGDLFADYDNPYVPT